MSNGAIAKSKPELPKHPMDAGLGIFTPGHFDQAQRVATALSQSTLVPKQYQGQVSDCLLAFDMAARLKANPLMVMQSLYIVHGKPSWSSSFIAGMINTCGKFGPVQYDMRGEGDARGCVAFATFRETGERIEGPEVTIGMAKAEGWYGKNGSKWQTMPELMLRYRAVTLFGRLYAPEILLGMPTQEEVIDIESSVSEVEEKAIPQGKIGAPQEPKEEPETTPVPVKKKRGRRKETKSEPDATVPNEAPSGSADDQKTETIEVLPDPGEEPEEVQQLKQLLADNGFSWSDFVFFMKTEQEFDIEAHGTPPNFLRAVLKNPDALLAGIDALRSGQ